MNNNFVIYKTSGERVTIASVYGITEWTLTEALEMMRHLVGWTVAKVSIFEEEVSKLKNASFGVQEL